MLYDVIVVGAGVEGTATAYSSVQDGYSTLLIEQFPLPHSRGSSHGQSRIIRKAYDKDHYARMMNRAYDMWESLEKQEEVSLIEKCGGLTLGQTPSGDFDAYVNALTRLNAPHSVLTTSELRDRFPMFRVDSGYRGLYDPMTGVIRADRTLLALWSQFRKRGGVIRDGEPVVEITPGKTVVITTPRQQYRARSVVICAGPWTSRVLKPLGLQLPLEAQRIGVFYWKTQTTEFASTKKMPCCIFIQNPHIYGLPSLEYPEHFKLCLHRGDAIDPEARDSQKALETNQSIVKKLKDFVAKHFPGLDPEPSIEEVCIYTMTPDEDFVLDTHPMWDNIVIGAGFSGHGFKLAPVVGKLLAELATGRKPSFDMKPFKISRFKHSAKL